MPPSQRALRLLPILLSLTVVAAATAVWAPPAHAQVSVERLSGPDRYATAAAISRSTFSPGVPVAFVATGADFPDSLAGGPAAARVGGPILLVTRNGVPSTTRAELIRLQPERIVVLGGAGVVSDVVATELAGLTSGSVTRFAGRDRYATAAAISAAHFAHGAPVAYIATGRSFPDALAAGAAAAALGGPVLLVEPNGIPTVARSELERLAPLRIVVVGGTAAVADSVVNDLRTYTVGGVTRQAGTNRYATASAISAQTFGPGTTPTVFVASGLGFADAVAGVPAAAIAGAPLLLASTTYLPVETTAELRRLQPNRIVLLGGTAALSDRVAAAARSIGSLAVAGPHTFIADGYRLQTVPINQLIYYGETLLGIYGTRDSSGAYMYRAGDGRLYDHPVGQAQYIVNMLRNYRLKPDQQYMDLAIANASRLLQRAVPHGGGLFFPYGFDFALHGRGTMRAPWFSGMAQGIALSAFVRLYEWTGDARWLEAAHRTFASFLVRQESGKPWVTVVDDGLLWFEEYPWAPYDHTYNGHNFATFGLYDYWRLTGSEDARWLTVGGFTTMARVASVVRVAGGVSHYCIAQSCLDRKVRNRNYHLVHTGQAVQAHRYTAAERFAALAETFTADYPDFRRAGTTAFTAGEHVGYAFGATGIAEPRKSLNLSKPSIAPFAQRTVPHGWSRPGNGIWLFMSAGYFEGLWIRESSQAYARGFVDRLTFLWQRPQAVSTGTWTARQYDSTGAITATKTTSTAATTWHFTSSARINGRHAVLLSSGPLSGYWLTTALPGTAGIAANEDSVTTAEPAWQPDDTPGSTPLPPEPSGTELSEPMPGQLEDPLQDAP